MSMIGDQRSERRKALLIHGQRGSTFYNHDDPSCVTNEPTPLLRGCVEHEDEEASLGEADVKQRLIVR